MNESTCAASDLPVSPMTFRALWQRLMRQKTLILLVVVFSLLLTGLITWVMSPSFRTASILHLEKQGAQVVNAGELHRPIPGFGASSPFSHAQYEQLKSSELMIKVVDDLNPEVRLFGNNFRGPLFNLLLGGGVGFILGVALALLRESRSASVGSIDELQAFSGLPVLGTIPNVNKKNRRILSKATSGEVGFPLAEAYRIAATNLKYAGPEGVPQCLLLTSLEPGEGKSTSSINLAVSLSQIGHKVLLIDTDLRRPALHEKMGLNNHVGLTEYLHGDIKLSRVTQRISGVNNAFVITAGMINLDPVEALSSTRMKELVEMAAQYFDTTVLDAPPLTGFADALLLAEIADATLLVSSEDAHADKGRLSTALKQLQRVKQNVIGWLIVKARSGVVSEKYYARYRQASRKGLDITLTTPILLQKKGLNLTKSG
uniref:non-specific protein-tyrosine kinase n=1 Tax=uncultured Thiotrichaceae bacterium TaxID=298394 RepID=A0A6S6U1V8_9GAMM|nr:MAG: Tyrosine-protein kinase EpsD (EC [uncultured Thiotrichaceae bacterium]